MSDDNSFHGPSLSIRRKKLERKRSQTISEGIAVANDSPARLFANQSRQQSSVNIPQYCSTRIYRDDQRNSNSQSSEGSPCESSVAPEQLTESVYRRGRPAPPMPVGSSIMSSFAFFKSLQNPASLSLISSVRSAYGVFKPSLRHRTFEVEGLEEEGEKSGGDRSTTGKARFEPSKSQGGDWSIYDNANRSTPAWIAMWNSMNMIQGSAVFAVPYACEILGWTSIPVVALIMIITCFTGHLVGECLYKYPDVQSFRQPPSSHFCRRTRVRSTIACVARDVLSVGGQRFVGLLVLMDMFGSAVIYLILIGKSGSALFNPIIGRELAATTWSVIIGWSVLPFLLSSNLHIIGWFSIIGAIGIHCCIVIATVFCSLQLRFTSEDGLQLPPPDWAHVPTALCIFVFSFTGHAALPGIEGSLKHPESYPKVLDASFSIAGLVKLSYGVFASIVLGKTVTESVADSMTAYPKIYVAMNSCTLFSLFFNIPLFFFILCEQLDAAISPYVCRGFLSNRQCCSLYTFWFLSTRCGILAAVLLVTVLVPQFAQVMGFLGAVSGSMLALTLPSVFHLYLFWSYLGWHERTIRLAVGVLGLFTCATGVIYSPLFRRYSPA
ncbi:unnamed protein product [Calicophoron daubneyi]|uniref:Amino acid transporter transmembrane domain-containing protein n=1 Tax=Calicophoron daubneyi TaxID=300641 RepID=A0AAV2TFH4_CALDB